MTPTKTFLFSLALGTAAAMSSSTFSQEPVVAAVDPAALFTDKDPTLNANKQAVLHIMRELLQCNHWDEADKYLTERYLQHNPNVTSGRANVIKYFGPPPRTATCGKLTMPVVTVLTSGNIVGVVFRAEYDDPLILLCDRKISNLKEFVPLLEQVVQTGRPLMIICEEYPHQGVPFMVTRFSVRRSPLGQRSTGSSSSGSSR